ncbi:MAG TPA: bifunctional UDP-3-O-[3-hydroxymyristoyl] N-acetylglucosamine deacetylase/3-hydroxyacyl-ACP dehydratase [Methylomirabilota bacterium]|nr:bifunctional UDP-3-O-[3-hydroxymyristoyl] N-acetylglucosamine deacetylase/3-hydroxyacyl-ACP dehydratase [Methylomirabilota bacterium]
MPERWEGRGAALAGGIWQLAMAKTGAFNRAVLQQQTLSSPAIYAGVGLHSGNRVNMTLLPAPANTGIRFRRVDLEGRPEIEARVENVHDTNRSTTLARGNVRIHTVEHVLATLAGFQIDNAIVELDASEPPVGDGSAREFSRVIQAAGITPLAERKEPYAVSAPMELEVGESTMAVFPHDRLRISCTSADRQGRFTQFYSVELNPETWERDLAHARTFCFYDEIEYLIRNGLIKGGSLENAVVIRDDAILTTEPLRYPEEFVRHKMLDIVGDLALFGRPLVGHVIAVKPSHTANCELVRQLQVQMRKPLVAAQSFSPPPRGAKIPARAAEASTDSEPAAMEGEGGEKLDVMEVMKILPHRYPFLMVDKVTRIEGNRITGVKNVTINESYFTGHFPTHPVMPGVLQLEAIAQVAGILMLRQLENAGKIAYFMSAESVKWRKPVRPGDVLVIDVELTKSRGKIGKARGTCSVGRETVSEAEVAFMLMDA